MADFSTIVQSAEIRALVQDGILERKFNDALFPALLFISEATDDDFPLNVGDSMTFTGRGLLTVSAAPIMPGQDLPVASMTYEQWNVSINKYGNSIDSDMPTSVAAAASLFLSNSHTLGLNGGQTMNVLARDTFFNAAMSGWGVCDGAQNAVTTLRVKRINGFTSARNPNLANGSPVQYAPVSTSNPLTVTVNQTAGGAVTRTVTGFTADNAGDLYGPGTLTLAGGAVTVADRDSILAIDRTDTVFVGGGNSVDAIGSNDILKLADVRSIIATMENNNVPRHPDGYFHCHLDAIGELQVQADSEWRQLFTAMPNDYRFAQFAIGRAAGAIWFKNTVCPTPTTVVGGSTATYSTNDPFGGEVWSNGSATTGVPIHRALVTGFDGMKRYTQKTDAQITEAGVTGKVGQFSITNNGITVDTNKLTMIIRAPLDRAQEKVATSWKWVGNFVERTDGATGDASRYKRATCVQYGAAS